MLIVKSKSDIHSPSANTMTDTKLPEMPESVTVSQVILRFAQENSENGTPYRISEAEIHFDVQPPQHDVTSITIVIQPMSQEASTLDGVLDIGLRMLKARIQGISSLPSDFF